MEPWPAVAWVLLLTFITDWLEIAHSRDFTEQDIICLHPSTTPYPGGFKCFTCEDASDNYQCNRWAPDLYCPQEARYCYTHHEMDAEGSSVSVTKRCVPLEDCLSTGCSEDDHEGHRVCTACCEGNICNLALPRNETEAVFTTTSPLSDASTLSQSYGLASALLTLTFLTSTYI
ncbi:ly6/PLAUR domain-containing protein 6 [Hypomesus transpacificus]|uniref:ly6/PLAUR domain-containing protein 6 n=1 Tax=Hypomesus transpacificus TaxID=137520 RepID=UPI001F07380D|nr:ly6/PLAUR domain-containing protein 6 [Hypomesus transpacificus]XP_046903764.1 ly6/PLAUR domain-containing protein 6 [Hypomesus transpacificus]XP_046903766.1 ly6/PLAUR domain-containing protein 6 [Hypomesus transpacificus]